MGLWEEIVAEGKRIARKDKLKAEYLMATGKMVLNAEKYPEEGIDAKLLRKNYNHMIDKIEWETT